MEVIANILPINRMFINSTQQINNVNCPNWHNAQNSKDKIVYFNEKKLGY